MPRILITVTTDMDNALKRESNRRNTPVAALVREAIEEWAKARGIALNTDIVWGGWRPRIEGADDEKELVAVSVR